MPQYTEANPAVRHTADAYEPEFKVDVLLVGDRREDLTALRAVLDVGAYDFVQALSAWEALGALDKQEFAVIVLDARKPDSNGISTAKAIREREESGDVSMIVIVPESEDVEKVYGDCALEATDYVLGSVDRKTLRATVGILAELHSKSMQVRQQATALGLANELLQREMDAHTQIEDRADEQERTLKCIMAATPDWIVLKDRQSRVQLCSRAYCEHLGRPEEEVVGTDPFEWYAAAEAQQYRDEDIQVMEAGQPLVREHRLKSVSDGHYRWMEAIKAPLRDRAGEVAGLLSTERDITQRKEMEELLHIQRDLAMALSSASSMPDALDQLLDSMLRIDTVDCGGVYVVDQDSGGLNLIAARGLSPQFVEHTSHYGPDAPQTRLAMAGESVYSRHSELFGPLDETRRRESLRALAVIPVRHEGQVIAVLNLASHEHDEVAIAARNSLELIASLIDSVLARVKAEEALRGSENLLRTLIDTLPDNVYAKDREGRLVLVNLAQLESFGKIDMDEVIGKTDFDLVPAEFAEQWHQHDVAVLESGELVRVEETYRDSAGEMHWFSTIKVPLRDVQGNVTGLVGMDREITERKRMEEEVTRAVEELRRSNAELEQFAYVTSHDLQEPLRSISGYLALLQRRYEGKLDAEADTFINRAVAAVDRLQGLIRSLLAYSRVGRRGKPFELTDCEVVLQRALSNLQVSIAESGAVVTHDPLPTIMADGSQLGQLFQNLIGNAIKFRTDAVPEIHVGAEHCRIQERIEWRFSVKDNGIGIDPQYAERIFGIFQRLHTRSEYSGTGIGLSICHRIVERHGGRIWVESEPGAGAVFYFTIPE